MNAQNGTPGGDKHVNGGSGRGSWRGPVLLVVVGLVVLVLFLVVR